MSKINIITFLAERISLVKAPIPSLSRALEHPRPSTTLEQRVELLRKYGPASTYLLYPYPYPCRHSSDTPPFSLPPLSFVTRRSSGVLERIMPIDRPTVPLSACTRTSARIRRATHDVKNVSTHARTHATRTGVSRSTRSPPAATFLT